MCRTGKTIRIVSWVSKLPIWKSPEFSFKHPIWIASGSFGHRIWIAPDLLALRFVGVFLCFVVLLASAWLAFSCCLCLRCVLSLFPHVVFIDNYRHQLVKCHCVTIEIYIFWVLVGNAIKGECFCLILVGSGNHTREALCERLMQSSFLLRFLRHRLRLFDLLRFLFACF